jgi:hypothetical protein
MERIRPKRSRGRPRSPVRYVPDRKNPDLYTPHAADALYPAYLDPQVVRLAAAIKLVKLYEKGRLPVEVMRAIDRVRVSERRRSNKENQCGRT